MTDLAAGGGDHKLMVREQANALGNMCDMKVCIQDVMSRCLALIYVLLRNCHTRDVWLNFEHHFVPDAAKTFPREAPDLPRVNSIQEIIYLMC